MHGRHPAAVNPGNSADFAANAGGTPQLSLEHRQRAELQPLRRRR
jgi:hypothetical protein